MDKLLFSVSFVFLMILTISCDGFDSKTSLRLEPQEIPFNADIRSIKKSVYDDCILLGMETGTIIRKDIANDVADTINAGYGRIYDILEHKVNDTVSAFWVGVRDEGLVELYYDRYAQRLVAPAKHYPIPLKNTHYSVYAFDLVEGQLYIGTTAGFFRKHIFKSDRLELITDSFIVNKIAHFENMQAKTIYLATDKGLFAYYANENRIEKVPISKNEKEIISIHPEGGKDQYLLNVITDNKHFQKDILSGNITLKKDFSKDHVEFVNYLHSTVNDHSWYVTNCEVTYKAENREIRFPVTGSVTRYNSLITRDFLFVPCIDKLLCFSLHEAVVDKKDDIMAISEWFDDRVYLITRDFHLYCYSNEKNRNQASKIKEVDINEEILHIQVTSGHLWFCSRKKLYQTDKNGKHLKVLLDCSDYSNKEEIQSCRIVKSKDGKAIGIYIGLRGGFYYLPEEGIRNSHPWQIVEVEKDSLINRDLFVNNIQIKDNQVYIATLNRGIYRGKLNRLDGFEYIPSSQSDTIGNPESMLFHKTGSRTVLCIHTNRGIYMYDDLLGPVYQYQGAGDKQLRSFQSGNENITYILKHKGVRKIPSSKDAFLFNDVAFRKGVFSANDNVVVCAGNTGLFLLDYEKESMQRIKLEGAPAGGWINRVVIFVLLAAGIGTLSFFFFRYRMKYIRLKNIDPAKNESIEIPAISSEELKGIKEKLELLIYNSHLPSNRAQLKYELARLFDKYFANHHSFQRLGKTDKGLVMMLALINYYRSQDVIDILNLKGKNKKLIDPNTIDQWRNDIRQKLQLLLKEQPERSDMLKMMLDNLRSR